MSRPTSPPGPPRPRRRPQRRAGRHRRRRPGPARRPPPTTARHQLDRRAAAPRHRRGRPGRHPRRLHRLRLRPVPGPDPDGDEHLAGAPRRSSAVGIYISGDSRACRDQPNLTPTWVRTQATQGLAPAADHPRARRPPASRGSPATTTTSRSTPAPAARAPTSQALKMGEREAVSAVAAAQALGIAEGSTLWYDLEGFDHNNTACRESALSFLTGWTQKLHTLDYVSGVYSSASSGIKALDDARVNRPEPLRRCPTPSGWRAGTASPTPRAATSARTAGAPAAASSSTAAATTRPGAGCAINIDSNFLDLGKGSTARPQGEMCGGTRVNWPSYEMLRPPRETKNGTKTSDPAKVAALQCLLKQRGYFDGRDHRHVRRPRRHRHEGLAARPRASPRRTSGRARTGCRCWPPAPRRPPSTAPAATPCAACSAASTPPPPRRGSS